MEAKALCYWRGKCAVDGMRLAERQKMRCQFWWYESADGYSNHRVVIRGNGSRIDTQFPTMLDTENSGVIKQLAKLEKGEELEVGLLTPENHGLPILEYIKILATGRDHLVHHMFQMAQE